MSPAKKKPAPRRPARPRKSPRPAAARTAPRRKTPARKAPVPAKDEGRAFPVEVEPGRIEESLKKVRDELVHWANKGRYTRVRFKFRGKQLLPDVPLAAVVAAEGLSFYWAGILRALLVSLGAGALLQVELVNDADKRILEGREALLAGDADKALELFRKAQGMARDNAGAHLNIGIVLKLKGDHEGARAALAQALALDPKGAAGQEAERVLKTLRGQASAAPGEG